MAMVKYLYCMCFCLATSSLLIAQSLPVFVATYTEVMNEPDGEPITILAQLTYADRQSYYRSLSSTEQEIFIDRAIPQVIRREYWQEQWFIIQERLPDYNWQLFSGSKRIAGFICRSASGTYDGRHYLAWYTEALPVDAGPQKFRGLPGLIVAVEEKNGGRSWTLTGLEESNPPLIHRPHRGIPLSSQRFAERRRRQNHSAH